MPTRKMVKMTAYKLIQQLEDEGKLNSLLSRGIVPINWVDYKLIYEYYQGQAEKEQKRMQAITNTAEEFNISERSVYVIIQKMRS